MPSVVFHQGGVTVSWSVAPVVVPDAVVVRTPHAQRVVSAVEVRERRAAFRPELNPVVAVSLELVRVLVSGGIVEVQRRKFEVGDVVLVRERDSPAARRSPSRRSPFPSSSSVLYRRNALNTTGGT